jgi:hypothetical protein
MPGNRQHAGADRVRPASSVNAVGVDETGDG